VLFNAAEHAALTMQIFHHYQKPEARCACKSVPGLLLTNYRRISQPP